MIKHYIISAYRQILRRPAFSVINIFGLSIGLSACLLILMYVFDELSYDRFHSKADRMYRISVHGVFGSNEFNSTYTPAPLAAAMLHEFPEVENVTRLMLRSQHAIQVGDKSFIEDGFLYADSTFFEVFDFKLLEGDPKKVLTEPRSIVLTSSAAKRYFGNENPMGKTIRENNEHHYTVTGIVADVPENSHFRFNVIASFTSIRWHANPSWFQQSAQTYLLLREGANANLLREKLPDFLQRNIREQLQQFIGITMEEFEASGQSYGYDLQLVTSIHLHSDLDGELGPNGNITYVYLFSLIALFILLLACINFMNLSTARSTSRAKEVGVRKVLGSGRSELVKQFLGESLLYSLLAMVIALILVEIALPHFNHLAGKTLAYQTNYLGYYLLIIPAFVLITGIFAGSYPAFYLSSFEPLKVMKGQFFKGVSKSRLRSILVLIQYAVSAVLLISTFIVYMQLRFIQDKEMGYDKEGLLVIKRVHGLGEGLSVFKNSILQHPNITHASYCLDVPGDDFSTNSMGIAGRPLEEVNIVNIMYADEDFLSTMGMQMSQGRWFDTSFGTDSMALVINESGLKTLGMKDFMTEKILMHDADPAQHRLYHVIGVVNDFHFESLHRDIRPMTILLRQNGWFNRMVVRVEGAAMQDIIQFLDQEWQKMETGQPFVYTSLEQNMAVFYQNEERTRTLYTLFSLLALFVASLGLFGLAAYTTESRTREISIRKVLGSDEWSIVRMLASQFAIWVVVANLIAWPVAWLFMDQWLNNFAYRVDMPWLVFPLSSILSLLIALLTVLWQAIKAARINPSQALKYE